MMGADGRVLRTVDQELLRSALDRGYFETPARVSVRELADEFGLSETEARRRLSQGLAVILKEQRDGDSETGLLEDPTTWAV